MSDHRTVRTTNPKPAGLTPVVSFEDVSKVYGKVRAVDRLSLGPLGRVRVGTRLHAPGSAGRHHATANASVTLGEVRATAGTGYWSRVRPYQGSLAAKCLARVVPASFSPTRRDKSSSELRGW